MNLLNKICILISLFCVGGLLAAELEPALESELITAEANHSFSIIVKLHSPRDIRALDEQLHQERAPLAQRHLLVIQALKNNARDTQGPVLQRLERMVRQGQVEGYTPYWIENLVVVQGNAEAVTALANDPAVESIGYNFRTDLIEPMLRGPIRGINPGRLDNEVITRGQRATGATRVNRELGLTGEGTIIAGLDTGVDSNHPALHSRWRGLTHPAAECWLDLIGGGGNNPSDGNGHGTHTMGTMTGREIRANGDTITVGAAPGAQWIACNAINQGVGPGFTQDIFDAFEWLTDPDGDSTTIDDVPDVVQNSWGVTTGHVGTHCYNNWNTVILNCEAAGPVIIWSAGNEGPTAQTLRSPATYQLTPTSIFSVGASDLSSDSTAPYPIADFSSRGPSGCAPNVADIKPEICAPGVNIYSCIPNNQYTDQMSGTSMAGPHISGIVALMREACPDCDPQTIKEALLNTAVDTGPAGDDNTFGRGFVNAYDAVMSVFSVGRVEGQVTTTGGAALPGVTVQALNTTTSTRTDSSGNYTLRMRNEGTYSLRFSKFGYDADTVNNVVIVAGDTVLVDAMLPAMPQGTLAGHVVLQSGTPVVNARVTFPGTPLDNVITDSTGRFVQTLPASSYQVHIEFVFNLVPPRGYALDTTVSVNVGDTTHITFPVFVEMMEPSGADAYGYRSYDRYDRGLPCGYDWQVIDSTHGGTVFRYGHQDSSVYFRAPFPISFYGQLSDSLTVNCNGWMLPGVHHERGNIDTRIPLDTVSTPHGIIAPFWNDLAASASSTARQYVRYDSAAGRWIFQFANQRLQWPNNYQHNWEVQLLDPAFYPTATGDAEIMFLYGSMGWLTSATIGIENPARTTGIQVRHDSSVAVWSWPIENGSSMRFSTGRATQYGHATVNLTLYPAPANGTALAVHVGGRTITSTYGATLGADSVPAAPVSAALAMAGYELGRADRVTIAPNVNTNVAIEAWRLDPPRNVGGSQNNGAVMVYWTRPQSVEIHANAALRYNVYRNDTLVVQALSDTFYTDIPRANGAQVNYTVAAVYRYGKAISTPFQITIDLAVTPSVNGLPTVYALYPNYPNPFNPETQIRLDIPSNTSGKLEVYDLQGRLVKTLYSGSLAAGRYQYRWSSQDEQGRSVASGLYFCRFASPTFTATQKMMLIK